MTYTISSVTGSALLIAAFTLTLAAPAAAQYGTPTYGGTYGGTFGNTTAGGYYGNYYGSAGFRNPLTYGGAGYGYGNSYGFYRPALIYRSPSSLQDSGYDPWQSRTNLSTLEASIRRFRDLREDSRRSREYYSNEAYKEENPFDEFYYLRRMTP